MNEQRSITRAHRSLALVLALCAACVLGAPTTATAANYVVLLEDGAAPASIAKSVGAKPTMQFSEVADGFVANLTTKQLQQLRTHSQVLAVEEDAPFAQDDFSNSALTLDAFKRMGYTTDAFKRMEYDLDAFKRMGYTTDAFKRMEYDLDAFKRMGLDTAAFKRMMLEADKFEQLSLTMDAFKRMGYDVNAFKRMGFDEQAFKRMGIDVAAFKRMLLDPAAFKRMALDVEAFKRMGYDVDAFKRMAYDFDAFKRMNIDLTAFKRMHAMIEAFKRMNAGGAPFAGQLVPFGVARVGVSPTASRSAVDADIAILDTGVNANHPDLNVAGSISCVPGVSPADTSGHGTMVAGLAAARDNNIGIVGVAPGARIWSVRVADASGTIMESAALCGLEWVLANAKTIDVVNLSWSGVGTPSGEACTTVVPRSPHRLRTWRSLSSAKRPRYPWRNKVISHAFGPRYSINKAQAASLIARLLGGKGFGAAAAGDETSVVDPAYADVLEAVTCQIVQAGVTVVAAAGNDAKDSSEYLPAAWPGVIAVSSFADTDGKAGGKGGRGCMTGDRDDTFSSFSNFGSAIDIMAPGECLVSTSIGSFGYSVGTGTSFAAPLTSGAAALIAARAPNATPAQIRNRLQAVAEKGTVSGDPDRYREGVLKVNGL